MKLKKVKQYSQEHIICENLCFEITMQMKLQTYIDENILSAQTEIYSKFIMSNIWNHIREKSTN